MDADLSSVAPLVSGSGRQDEPRGWVSVTSPSSAGLWCRSVSAPWLLSLPLRRRGFPTDRKLPGTSSSFTRLHPATETAERRLKTRLSLTTTCCPSTRPSPRRRGWDSTPVSSGPPRLQTPLRVLWTVEKVRGALPAVCRGETRVCRGPRAAGPLRPASVAAQRQKMLNSIFLF